MEAALAAAVMESRAKAAPALIGTDLRPFVAPPPAPAEIAAPTRRRGPSRRMIQRRRAAHARARWPWKLQTLADGWTDAEACLIDALLYLGGATGEFEAYRAELGNRAGISPSAQRAAEAKLRSLGLLEVTENRLGYSRNEANSYRLMGVLREAARMLWVRRGEGTKLSEPSGGVENQQHHTSPTLTAPTTVKRTPGRRPPVAQGAPTSPRSGEVRMPLGRGEGAEPPAAEAAPDRVDERLALDLARTFLPDLAPDEAPPESAAELLAIADRLQRTYAPTLWPQVWRSWRARWGLTAALAIVETGLMRRGGKIRESGGQYLSGLLGRNRRQAPAPEATLQAMRAARCAPGLAIGRRWAPGPDGGRP
ncbi:hypothetical protein [Magnetospirillum sp. UT-4]|uniref:hypothetical protein n=1 Tax=Magnetospirillum sp. UT-4 TaxID=2681467 RepID=UPI001572AE81|nr:hypothetical protein [Magnetospirillum sp. UT-4]